MSINIHMQDPTRLIVQVVASTLLLLLAPPTSAQAPDGGSAPRPGAIVLQTASSPALRDLAQATGRLIRIEVDRADVVRTEGTPALYLEDLQMALGCLGETPECLLVVAQELGVNRLLYASLERSGARLLLTLAYFDGTQVHMVTRGVEAPAPDAAILDSVPAMVREVFGMEPLPASEQQVATNTPPPTLMPQGGEPAPPREQRAPRDPAGPRVGAYVATGAAVAALGAGAFLLSRRQAAEDDYRNAPVGTAAEVDAALADRARAQRLGRASIGVLAVAGAGALSAVVLGIVSRKRAAAAEDAPSVSASVIAGPGVVGLQLRGTL